MRRLKTLTILLILLAPAAAQAQITQIVLGVGKVAFDLPGGTTQAVAQGQKYRIYVPATATASTVLTVTCGAPVNTVVTCTFPLSIFGTGIIAPIPSPPAAGLGFALTSATVAADGEQETAKVVAPFVLQKGVPPVAPVAATMSIQAAP